MEHLGQLPSDIPLEPVNEADEARNSSLFFEHPELKRVVAIYDYLSNDGRGFQFKKHDEISLRSHYVADFPKGWFGVHLKSGESGIFPASHVRDITMEIQESCALPPSETELLESLTKAFRDQYGQNAEPQAIFKTVNCLNKVEPYEFWLSFSMAYINTAVESVALKSLLSSVHKALFTSRFTARFQLSKFSADASQWRFSKTLSANYYGEWDRWERVKVLLCDSIPRAVKAWENLRPMLVEIEEPIPHFDGMIERLDTLLTLLPSELDRMESQVLQAIENDARELRELERNMLAREQDIKMGILKTDSMSSGTDSNKHQPKLKNRWYKRAPPTRTHSHPAAISHTVAPLHRRIWDRCAHLSSEVMKETRWRLRKTGETSVVVKAIIFLSIASAVTTGLAAWKCTPPDTIPTIDSNFWSTVASALIGIAGLYCTIIPILLQQQIKVQNPRVFYALLWLSFLSMVAAVGVYPYQTRASLILLFLSSAAQLATTLQLILGAVTRIREDVEMIRKKDSIIANLRRG